MKRILVLALLLMLLTPASVRSASSTNVKVQILPLDCIFEIVADGLNTITYLTPDACNPPPPTPFPNISGSTPSVQPSSPRVTSRLLNPALIDDTTYTNLNNLSGNIVIAQKDKPLVTDYASTTNNSSAWKILLWFGLALLIITFSLVGLWIWRKRKL